MEYVYLLQEREFIKTGEPIYKVGMTKQEGLMRFKSYPKGSRLLIHICCTDSRTVEREIIKLFCEKFKQRLDIGFEYFEGDYKSMIKYVYERATEKVVVPEPEPEPIPIPEETKPIKYSIRQPATRDNLTIMKNLVKNYLGYVDESIFDVGDDVDMYDRISAYGGDDEYEFDIMSILGREYVCMKKLPYRVGDDVVICSLPISG